MVTRSWLYVVVAVVLLLLIVEPTDAGCCTIVTLDTLPRDVRAGESVDFGFTVQAHGTTIDLSSLTDEPPRVFAHNHESGTSVEIEARATSETGTYVAEVTFPHAGTWEWGIAPAPFPIVQQEPLTVLPSAPATASFSVMQMGVLVMLLASSLVLTVRRGILASEAAAVLGVVGLAILLVCVHVISSPPPTIAAPAATDDIAYGRALFVAKGCATCHVHAEVDSLSMSVGPNLTAYEPNQAFVRRWLRDPQAIRPQTFMPDLDLTETEIDALIAFLDAEHETH